MVHHWMGHARWISIVNPKERVLAAVKRNLRGEFPIQLDLTDRTLEKLGSAWGFDPSEDAKLSILKHHIVFARLVIKDDSRNNQHGQLDPWNVLWASDQEGMWVLQSPAADIKNLKEYRPPNVSGRIDWQHIQDKVHQYGEQYCVAGYQNALLFERAWSLIGFERLLFEMYDDPQGVVSLLDAITENQVSVAEQLVRAGIDIARTGDDWGGQQGMLFSPKMWRQLIKPRLAQIWKVYQTNSVPIIHHSCGDIRPILDDLVDLGLDVLHPIQPEAMPRSFIADKYGSHLSFYGGVSEQTILPYGTPEEVAFEVDRCIGELGKYNGYILAPSQAITSDVPIENIEVLLEAMSAYCHPGV